MKTTKGKLRNITSSILHTNIGDVYEFFNEYIEDGIMTHHLPSACRAIIEVFKQKEMLSDEWYSAEWVKTGLDEEIEIPDLTRAEKKKFWKIFDKHNSALWDKIKDKTIIVES